MRSPRAAVIGWVVARLARLRFPTLFVATALLFVVDLIVPDAIPLVDELLLGLGTALLASWRTRDERGRPRRA
jgi:hypothetical protein